MNQIHDITEVHVTGPHRLLVAFDDGESREIDMSSRPSGPVFDALADPDEFARVRVDEESGTIVWPSGADVDPIGIYECRGPLVVRRVAPPLRRP